MENNSIQGDLIRGHIDTIILKSLSEGDKYGYEICREVEIKSGGNFILKQPTLYSSLKRLETQNFISSYWGELTKGARRKYYKITQEGKDFLSKNQSSWEYSRGVIDALLSQEMSGTAAQSYQSPVQSQSAPSYETPAQSQNGQYTPKTDATYESAINNSAPFDREISENINIPYTGTENASYDHASHNGAPSDNAPYSGAPSESAPNQLDNNQDKSQAVYETIMIENEEPRQPQHVSKLSEELRQKITQKFNEAKSMAQNRAKEGVSDWVKNGEYIRASQKKQSQSDDEIKQIVTAEIESDKYKNKLEKIFELKKSASASEKTVLEKTEIQQSSPAQTQDQDEKPNSVSMAVRYHSPSVYDKDTYYVYSNKFRIAYYCVMSFLMFLEILLCHAVFNNILGIHIDSGYYLSAGLIAIVLPFVSFIFYFYDSEKKKKIRYGLKYHFAKKTLYFFEISALIFIVLLVIDQTLFSSIQSFAKAILPLIIASNLIISAPIAKIMYKLKVCSVNE